MKNNYFELIQDLVKTDFKLKYQRSFFGFFWSFIKPLLMMSVLYVVFTFFMKIKVESYILFLLLGVILWNYFADSTKDSMASLESKKSIITKTKVPLFLIILSACIHNFITLIVNLIIFFLIFLLLVKTIYISSLLVILFLILLFIQTLGISLIIIPLHSKFGDFRHLWDIILQLGFWATPIVYTIDFVSGSWKNIILLNPIARIIVYSRSAIILGTFPNLGSILITLFITSIFALIGIIYFYFKRKEVVEQI